MYSYNVAFCRGGETTGSVGKCPAVDDNKQLVKPASFDTVEIGDTVNFRGRGEEKSSIAGKILKTGMLAALVVGRHVDFARCGNYVLLVSFVIGSGTRFGRYT